MKKRLTMALAAGALVAAMLPGVAQAADDQTNLGRCVSEAKQALQGTGIKLKVGQFDDIVLGTNGDDFNLANPAGPTLICGFGGADAILGAFIFAGDVFVGGAGGDGVSINGGTFIGGDGADVAFEIWGGFFDGGPGSDAVYLHISGGTCVNVESTDSCPAP